MKLDIKEFNFEKELQEINKQLTSVIAPFEPSNKFSLNKDDLYECSKGGVLCVCIRTIAYDNSKVEDLLLSYEISKKMVVDILRSNDDCVEVLTQGRYFTAIFNASLKSSIDSMIETMAKVNASLSVLNIKLHEKFKIQIEGNTGCDYGVIFRLNNYEGAKVLENSSITNKKFETWHGSPINQAMIYASSNILNGKNRTFISPVVKDNLKEEYKKFFDEYDDNIHGFYTTLVNSVIYEWVKNNKQ